MCSVRADSSLFPLLPLCPDDRHERALLLQGRNVIAGIDEAGRGPLAGPVVAAAVVLDLNNFPKGLNDSKKLTEKQREELYGHILKSALAISIASVSAEIIDEINILNATMLAMKNAADGLALMADHLLIDGNKIPDGLPCAATALVKGDQRSVSIAAASIIAKVTRDAMIMNAGFAHPEYGFESHKGYGSATVQIEAMSRLGGVKRLHRFSFSPLKNKKPPEGGF